MIILPSTYLPSISHIAALLNGEQECIIDIGEHYIKRSARNRAQIMSSQGVMELTIPVHRANTPRQPMHQMRIDNSKRWQHQHWNAIIAAYRSSPYFEHYAPYLEPLYKAPYESLVEFNSAMLRTLLKLLQVELKITISNNYLSPTEEDIDLRPKGSMLPTFVSRPYIQVFDDRESFADNLSILDLLLCEGTNALEYVGVSRR